MYTLQKTPMSLTDDPKIKTLPNDYIFNIKWYRAKIWCRVCCMYC